MRQGDVLYQRATERACESERVTQLAHIRGERTRVDVDVGGRLAKSLRSDGAKRLLGS